MAKYELRPLSDSRKADIVRSALAHPSAPKAAQASASATSSVKEMRSDARAMMDRAFRAATKA